MLQIQSLDPLRSIHGPEGGHVDVGEAGGLALVHDAPDPIHQPEPRRYAPTDQLRRSTVDLEELEAVRRVLADAESALAIPRLEISLPEIGRLENVAVGVDAAVVAQARELPRHGADRTAHPIRKQGMAGDSDEAGLPTAWPWACDRCCEERTPRLADCDTI
jgi:hypothetical protein